MFFFYFGIIKISSNLIMSYCAPSDEPHPKDSCFSAETLNALYHAIVVNQSQNQKQKLATSRQQQWNYLDNAFSPNCGHANEACWIDDDNVRKQVAKNEPPNLYQRIYTDTFRPMAPPGAGDWMTTSEIEAVLSQYERAHKNFAFLGCRPSDYYILHPEAFPASRIESSQYSAVIFNLDESDQPGSHWIALFFENLPNGMLNIEHFDSIGDVPIPNILAFMDNESLLRRKRRIMINNFEHQLEDGECGVYAMWYVISRLLGATPEIMNSRPVNDAVINRYRKYIFRPYRKKNNNS